MKETINLLSISSYLSTSYHIKEILMAIEQLQTGFFKKNQRLLITLEKEVPFPLCESLKKLAIEHQVNLEDTAEANEFLNKLQEAIEQIPRLTITLSMPPTLELIKEINRWMILNVKQTVVLDFMIDNSLVAGAKVAFNGKVKDYSVKKQIEFPMQILAKG